MDTEYKRVKCMDAKVHYVADRHLKIANNHHVIHKFLCTYEVFRKCSLSRGNHIRGFGSKALRKK